MDLYFLKARPILLGRRESSYFFVTHRGNKPHQKMTTQNVFLTLVSLSKRFLRPLFPQGITGKGFRNILSTQIMANDNPELTGDTMEIGGRALLDRPDRVKDYAEPPSPEREMAKHNQTIRELRASLGDTDQPLIP